MVRGEGDGESERVRWSGGIDSGERGRVREEERAERGRREGGERGRVKERKIDVRVRRVSV